MVLRSSWTIFAFVWLQKCHLHSVSTNGGAVTAQRRDGESENTGYSFVDCKVTGMGVGTMVLGRPWGAYSRVVFAFTYMTNSVAAQGWNDWGDPNNQRYVIEELAFRSWVPSSWTILGWPGLTLHAPHVRLSSILGLVQTNDNFNAITTLLGESPNNLFT